MHELRIPGWQTVIRESVPFYKENLWYLVAVPIVTSLIAIVPLIVVLVAYAVLAFAVASFSDGSAVVGTVTGILLGILGIAAVCWLIIAMGASQVATIRASTEGRAVPFWKMIRESFAVGRALHVFAGTFLFGIMVMFGLVFFIAPGVYLLGRGAYLPFVLVKENVGVIDAFKRAWALSKGYWWVTMLRFGWLSLAAAGGTALIAVLFSLPSLASVRDLTSMAWQMLVVGPFAMVFFRRMYEMVRERKAEDAEAFHSLTSSEKWQVVGAILLFLVIGSVQAAVTPKADPEVMNQGDIQELLEEAGLK